MAFQLMNTTSETACRFSAQ